MRVERLIMLFVEVILHKVLSEFLYLKVMHIFLTSFRKLGKIVLLRGTYDEEYFKVLEGSFLSIL